MKAYRMRRPDGNVVVRLVNGNEIIKDKDGSVLERVGGPIGGSNILPLSYQETDKFVPFKLDDNTDVTNEAQAKKAYEAMYSLKTDEVIPPPPEAPKPPVDEEEDEDGEDETTPRPRGRPRKEVRE